jgi:hypothetical protein
MHRRRRAVLASRLHTIASPETDAMIACPRFGRRIMRGIMKNPLESLQHTVVLGVVLTIVMVILIRVIS